jgi:small conductance mechanosensitive channel
MHEKVKKAFDEANITIPFPQRDVHVYNSKVE